MCSHDQAEAIFFCLGAKLESGFRLLTSALLLPSDFFSWWNNSERPSWK